MHSTLPTPCKPSTCSFLVMMPLRSAIALACTQANLHRADRTPPVKVLALQGDYHSHDSDVFPMLEAYCKVTDTTPA